MASPNSNESRNWYTLSEEALRAWLGVAVLAVLSVVGFFAYRQYEGYALKRDSAQLMEEVRGLMSRLQGGAGAPAFPEEYNAAWKGLEEAQTAFAAAHYADSLDAGKRSRALLLSIIDAVQHKGRSGEAQVVAVHGGVDFRHGERGEWEEARSRATLQAGDYVKTGANGSAEIMFLDGTLYTIRPNTLLLITRTQTAEGLPGEQSIKMEYGWVNLNTAKAGSRVTTPQSEARVREETQATVTFDQKSQLGRVAAYTGGVDVATASGAKARVGSLQQVTVDNSRVSAPQPLPGSPSLDEPVDSFEVELAKQRLLLAWTPVEAATRYALQVSRNRLFVDNVIDVENRSRTRATLGLRGEGTFEWRVAAINREGLRGPWSEPHRFRVAAASGGGAVDKVPPVLDLENVQTYGSIFIVSGRTEPGCSVEVNGELVALNADGAFTKTVQLDADGWGFVEVRSRDTAGNETTRRQRVFVDNL